jgi:hypothetical protein
MRLYVQRSDFAGGLNLFLVDEQPAEPKMGLPKGTAIALPVTLQRIDEGMMEQPTFCVGRRDSNDFLQHLMDELWALNVRPTEFKATTAEVEAIKYHLQDMRRLVFSKAPPWPLKSPRTE